MRAILSILALFFWPGFVIAGLQWHEFSVGGVGDVQVLTIGQVSFTIQTRDVRNADFKENYLVMTVRVPNRPPIDYWFESSYGSGELAIRGDILLLKYGVGRGTFVRVKHVRALRLRDELEELVDVQTSYYVLTDPKKTDPDLIEYKLKMESSLGYTTLYFTLSRPQKGIPSEKTVKLKNDG